MRRDPDEMTEPRMTADEGDARPKARLGAPDLPVGGGLWPTDRKARISDAEILADLVAKTPLVVSAPLTADLVYSAFLEAKKASDAWIKYYLISVMLMVLAAVDALTEVSLPMAKLEGAFIGPAALVAFSICGLAFTNHELKIRPYRAFFDAQLAALDGPDRGAVLLRYPLAFTGAAFLPFAMRPARLTLGWLHLTSFTQVFAILQLGWLVAVPGLMLLVCAAGFGVLTEARLPLWVRGAVLVFTLAATLLVGGCLRRADKKHLYVPRVKQPAA